MRYAGTNSGWRTWFRWLRVMFRPFTTQMLELRRCWHRNGDVEASLEISAAYPHLGPIMFNPARLAAIQQWRARDFEAGFWNNTRRRIWEAKVRDYPHGIAQAYIGGPLVIP